MVGHLSIMVVRPLSHSLWSFLKSSIFPCETLISVTVTKKTCALIKPPNLPYVVMKSTCLLVKHPLNHGFSSPLAAFSFCQKSMGFFGCEILAPILPYPRATRGVKSVKSVDENDEVKTQQFPPISWPSFTHNWWEQPCQKKTLC